MGKKEKEHRKKVAKRNERLALERKKFEKQQRNFLMELIEKEKAAGKFDNNPTIPFNLTGDISPILGQPLSVSPDTIGPVGPQI
ncbi:hypothetical protein EBU94_05250 [bacterium]|nr:hypothetical protein [bacterium]